MKLVGGVLCHGPQWQVLIEVLNEPFLCLVDVAAGVGATGSLAGDKVIEKLSQRYVLARRDQFQEKS
jgi:hypothetical protein